MSMNTREVEIAEMTATPHWVYTFQTISSSAETPPPLQETKTYLLVNFVKRTLFWSTTGGISSCLSLFIGKEVLEQLGYAVSTDSQSLQYAAIGGCLSYLIFKLLAEVMKCLKRYLRPNGAEALEESPFGTPQMILQSFILNLGGIFLGIVVLLHHNAPQKSQDELIASALGTGILFGSMGLIQGLRSC